MTDRKRPGVAFWATVVVVVIIPILYVGSSGPTSRVIYKQKTIIDTPPSRLDVVVPVSEPWWSAVYAPLRWASAKWWGQPLQRYWSLFPALNDPADVANIPPLSDIDISELPVEVKKLIGDVK
jgi:hypothetical protein